MEIINKSIHVINYDEQKIYSKDIPEFFNDYITKLIHHINTNTSIRSYTTRSQSTKVISNAKKILKKRKELNLNIKNEFKDNAEKLLGIEIRVQEQIAHLRTSVQKGSLVQSLLFDSQMNQYIFLLAKVEHSDFVDDLDFSSKTGFPKEKKNIWKSCLLYFDDSEELNISNAKIYSNTVAKYWSNDFLELDEMTTDENNTSNAFTAIDQTLASDIKNLAPKDYTVIRNNFIGYFKRNEHLDYISMIEEILGEYHPMDLPNDELQKLKEKLTTLPEKKHFDTQFNSIHSKIITKIKKIYKVNNGIEIKITDVIEDIKNTIKSVEEDGTRYLKIKITDDDTFKCFE